VTTRIELATSGLTDQF